MAKLIEMQDRLRALEKQVSNTELLVYIVIDCPPQIHEYTVINSELSSVKPGMVRHLVFYECQQHAVVMRPTHNRENSCSNEEGIGS